MHRSFLLLPVVLFSISCLPVQPEMASSRESVVSELPSLTAHERRREEIKKALNYMGLTGILEKVPANTRDEVKKALDIEYVFYHAALTSLAAGKLAQYRVYLNLADKELDTVVSALRAGPKSGADGSAAGDRKEKI